MTALSPQERRVGTIRHVRTAQGLAQDRTRYDRCAHTFFSAICIAATVIFYLN
jgi:hypothetical protein